MCTTTFCAYLWNLLPTFVCWIILTYFSAYKWYRLLALRIDTSKGDACAMNEAQVAKRKRKQAKKDEKKRLKLQQGVGGSEQSFSKKSRLSLAPLQCSSSSAPSSSWNFTVDYNDHFETPLSAYQDILPVLQCIADKKGKLIQDLILYDPYYCKGRMVEHLQSLGIRKGTYFFHDFYCLFSYHFNHFTSLL